MININDRKTRIIIGLVLVSILAGLLIYRDTRNSKEEGGNNATSTGSTLGETGISMIGDGKVEIVPLSERKLPKAPSLVRGTDYPSTVAPEVKTIVLSQMSKTIEQIRTNNQDVNAWVMLGVQRKTIGDYEGAREAWDYAKVLAPNEVVAYNNLGDLYHYYLKDFKKSEENWKKTIAIKSDYVQGYRGLVDLYKYSMTEKLGETPTLLKSGIVKNPDSVDLMVMLARYYLDAGDMIMAKEAYGKAIATSERINNDASVTETLKQELAGIK